MSKQLELFENVHLKDYTCLLNDEDRTYNYVRKGMKIYWWEDGEEGKFEFVDLTQFRGVETLPGNVVRREGTVLKVERDEEEGVMETTLTLRVPYMPKQLDHRRSPGWELEFWGAEHFSVLYKKNKLV